MLKFSDLSVDMKSYENSLDSYMKLFPRSFMPLLIMYLSKEGLLKVRKDQDNNNSRNLLSIRKEEVEQFFDINFTILKSLNEEEKNKQIKHLVSKLGGESIASLLAPFLTMFASGFHGDYLSLYVDCSMDSTLSSVIDIIMAHEPKFDEKAALMFFYLMIHYCPRKSVNNLESDIL